VNPRYGTPVSEVPVRALAPFALLVLPACWGRNIPYEGGTAGDDTAVVTTTCGEDVDRTSGFTVEGATFDLGTGGTAAPGLCVFAVDPTPALAGGEPTVLASSVVCDDGAYVVGPIASAPAVGMFVVIDDCDGEADTVMKTATGIPPTALAGLGAGDTLTVEAQSVSAEWLAVEQADIAAVGSTVDLATDGYMAGHVEDVAGEPVGGAVVGGAPETVVLYEDAEAGDGLYGAAGGFANTSTDADADAVFMIPKAPIFTYTCQDDGSHTWASTLLGSLPGYAVYIRFTAG
jgi:hypothetical protein